MNIGAFTTKYITAPIKRFNARHNIDTVGAIKSYNESLGMLVDHFNGKQNVPNCDLKAVYDTLMVAYSQILAARRIDKNMIKTLKKRGVAGMEWAHVARLSDEDRVAFVKSLSICPKSKMVQQAAFKNNSGKIMLSVLEDKEYRPLLEEAGINVDKFKNMLKTGQGDLFNLDILKNPLKDTILESEKGLALRMIRRIVLNERNEKSLKPEELLPCFDKKILSEKYEFPFFMPKLDYYRNAHNILMAETDKYLDAFRRFKVLGIVEAKINGKNIGMGFKER